MSECATSYTGDNTQLGWFLLRGVFAPATACVVSEHEEQVRDAGRSGESTRVEIQGP